LITNKYSDSWISQIYQDYRTGKIAVRGKNNGTWMPWLKPSYEGHTHDYLPLAGGTLTGGIKILNEKSIIFKTERAKESGGGWARSFITHVRNDDTVSGTFGIHGWGYNP
jgi:hypothetical protein